MTIQKQNKLLYILLSFGFAVSLVSLLVVRNPILLFSLLLVGASLGVVSLVLLRKRH